MEESGMDVCWEEQMMKWSGTFYARYFFRFFDIFSYFRYITQIKYPKKAYKYIEMITEESSRTSGQKFFATLKFIYTSNGCALIYYILDHLK